MLTSSTELFGNLQVVRYLLHKRCNHFNVGSAFWFTARHNVIILGPWHHAIVCDYVARNLILSQHT
jgi:hypothetical protein